MLKLTSFLVMILFLTSIPAKAEVKDPTKLKFTSEALQKDGLIPLEWFLIQEMTLRSLDKDSKALPAAEESLKKAQKELEDRVVELNAVNSKLHQLEIDIYDLRLNNYELDNPPWYKSAMFWAPAGFVIGAATTVVAAVMIRR